MPSAKTPATFPAINGVHDTDIVKYATHQTAFADTDALAHGLSNPH